MHRSRPFAAAHRLAVLMLVIGSVACADRSRPNGVRDATIRSVALADSVAFSNELIGTGYLHRVSISTADGTDTLPDVLTAQVPVLVGDSSVHGLLYEQDRVIGGFRYTPQGGVQRRRLPSDLYEYSTPRISPDGRYLAYFGRDSAGLGYAAVARFPDGETVYTGPRVRLLETDVPVSGVSWTDSSHFEIRIARSQRLGGILRVRGAVDSAAVVDTLQREDGLRPVAG